jgi:hypothetical protein
MASVHPPFGLKYTAIFVAIDSSAWAGTTGRKRKEKRRSFKMGFSSRGLQRRVGLMEN